MKNGSSVILPDGTTVHTKDVCSASDPGPIFILLDIPSVKFLDNFKEKEHLFAMHQQTASCDDDMAKLVVHFSPQHVIDDPVYQDFMKKFATTTQHLVLNETNRYVGRMTKEEAFSFFASLPYAMLIFFADFPDFYHHIAFRSN